MTIADYATYLVTDQARNLKSSRGKNHFFLRGGGGGREGGHILAKIGAKLGFSPFSQVWLLISFRLNCTG